MNALSYKHLRLAARTWALLLVAGSALNAAPLSPVERKRGLEVVAFEERVAADGSPLHFVARSGGLDFSMSATGFSTSYRVRRRSNDERTGVAGAAVAV